MRRSPQAAPLSLAPASRWVLALLAPLALLACQPSADETHADHAHPAAIRLQGAAAVAARFEGAVARFAAPPGAPAHRVGLLVDGAAPPLSWRGQGLDGAWGPWAPVAWLFSEGALHAATLDPQGPLTAVELHRGDGGALTALTVEFLPEALAVPEPWRARPPEGPVATLRQGLVPPPDFVVDRVAWGAREPHKLCNAVAPVYRFTVHHTASPADAGDMPARMRRIQAYHMDGHGWCDIGYHFVVSATGQIYQGRNDERRPGAHAGRNNDGNIGVAAIGNFDEGPVPEAQFEGLARLLRWAIETHGIAPDREHIRGHREWPTNNTACPGAHLFPRMDELIARALGSPDPGIAPEPEPGPDPRPEPEPAGPVDLPFTVRWVEPPRDRLRQGASAGTPDALVGEVLEAEILWRNASPQALGGLRLAWRAAGLRPLGWTWETDAPALDRQRWQALDGQAGALADPLELGALAPGESQRLRIRLAVDAPGRGLEVAAGLLAVEGLFARADLERGPSLNGLSALPEGRAGLDAVQPDAWRFPHEPAAPDADGWIPCDGATPPEVTAAGLALAPDRCLASPAWTRIDPRRFDGVQIQLVAATAGSLRLWWAGPEDDFDPTRRAVVAFPAGASVVALDLAGRPGFAQAVERLAIYVDQPVRLQAVAAQGPGGAADGAPRVAPGEGGVEPADPQPTPETPADPVEPVEDGTGAEDGDDEAREGEAPAGPVILPGPGAVRQLQGDGGCQAGAGPGPAGAGWALLALLALRRRRA